MSGGGQDVARVKAEITEMYSVVEDGSYYDILGLEPEASSDEITHSYRALAKKWHVDRYSTMDLGEYRNKLQKIFEAVNNAHRTLSDQQQRQEYDMDLSGEEGHDVVSILQADNAYRQGKNMLQMGKYKGAHAVFERAHELSPEDWEIEAHLQYTEYLLIPKGEDGLPRAKTSQRPKQIFDYLNELSEEHNESDWLLVFLGVVAQGLGKDRSARGLFQEAIYLNPSNHDAKRHLRLLDMRRKREKNQGFFQKLFARFGGK